MYNMTEDTSMSMPQDDQEETNKSSLVAALQAPLLLVPSKTTPLPSPPVSTPVPTIAPDYVWTIAAAFPDISTKVQLRSILNFKWKSPIYSSDANSIEKRDNGPDLMNEHISYLVSALSNSSDAPMNEPKSELDSLSKVIVLGNHFFVFEWSGKSCTVNPFNYCMGSINYVPINNSDIDYYFPYSHECYILLFHNALYLPNMEDKLFLPFIMREKGAAVNANTKIHCTDPTSKYQWIKITDSEMNMPLHINGTF